MELKPMEQSMLSHFENRVGNAKKAAERSAKSETEKEDRALMKACKEFESIFLGIMYKEMKKTVGDGGLVEKSSGTRIFEDMYMEELSKLNAEQSGLGVAKMLYDQFKFTQRNAVPIEEAMKRGE